jgi:hypothetical protein
MVLAASNTASAAAGRISSDFWEMKARVEVMDDRSSLDIFWFTKPAKLTISCCLCAILTRSCSSVREHEEPAKPVKHSHTARHPGSKTGQFFKLRPLEVSMKVQLPRKEHKLGQFFD